MNSEEFAIDVKNVYKNFSGKRIINDLSLQIKRGDIFGFLGPNGSGKTTSMRLLCGLLKADGGEGTCLGYNVVSESELIKRNAGYMPQFFSLYKTLTVYENLMLMARLHGLVDRPKIVRNMIDEFNLGPYKNQLSGSLSGGWKQTLSLAAALIHKPLLLLLDEPTASIDAQTRRAFWELMHDLSERGVTIMFTSHNTEEIEHSNHITYIYKGHALMSGTINDIIDQVELSAWSVTGDNLFLLAKQLRTIQSIEQVVSFPTSLRILGQDPICIENDIKAYLSLPHLQWAKVRPNIEDIFVFFAKKYELSKS